MLRLPFEGRKPERQTPVRTRYGSPDALRRMHGSQDDPGQCEKERKQCVIPRCEGYLQSGMPGQLGTL